MPLRRGVSPREQPADCRSILAMYGRSSLGPPRLNEQARGGAFAARRSQQEQSAAQAVRVGADASTRTAPSTVGRVGRMGQGRGRLRGLCLINVTVIVKLEAFLGGNVSQAASGAVVVNLA